MHTVLVVAAKPGKRVPGHLVELLQGLVPLEVYFEPQGHGHWASESGTVHFGGWEAVADVFGIGSHWHVADDGLTAFARHPFPLDAPWSSSSSWAEQLHQRFRSRPLWDSVEDFGGNFLMVSLSPDGRGCIASDPLGMGVVTSPRTRS